jgi:hypothetical protein
MHSPHVVWFFRLSHEMDRGLGDSDLPLKLSIVANVEFQERASVIDGMSSPKYPDAGCRNDCRRTR